MKEKSVLLFSKAESSCELFERDHLKFHVCIVPTGDALAQSVTKPCSNNTFVLSHNLSCHSKQMQI